MSACTYRYFLGRNVADGGVNPRTLGWVMLNPSTADELTDDPTIRRVIRFTRDAGYSDLLVCNLFAMRATRPVHLLEAQDPVGQSNWLALRSLMAGCDSVVCAWGAWPEGRDVPTIGLVQRYAAIQGVNLLSLGVTKGGSPRHPLYVKADTPFRLWRP